MIDREKSGAIDEASASFEDIATLLTIRAEQTGLYDTPSQLVERTSIGLGTIGILSCTSLEERSSLTHTISGPGINWTHRSPLKRWQDRHRSVLEEQYMRQMIDRILPDIEPFRQYQDIGDIAPTAFFQIVKNALIAKKSKLRTTLTEVSYESDQIDGGATQLGITTETAGLESEQTLRYEVTDSHEVQPEIVVDRSLGIELVDNEVQYAWVRLQTDAPRTALTDAKLEDYLAHERSVGAWTLVQKLRSDQDSFNSTNSG